MTTILVKLVIYIVILGKLSIVVHYVIGTMVTQIVKIVTLAIFKTVDIRWHTWYNMTTFKEVGIL